MNTVIVTQNGTTVVIPNTDWYLTIDKKRVVITDEIDHDLVIGNFNRDCIAGVYTDNPVRLKPYQPDEE